MVIVYIKKDRFFKNVNPYGKIFEIQYPTREIEQNGEIIKTTYDNYIENGFTKVELADEYCDAISSDFNPDFTFNEKIYRLRKQKAEIGFKITELINKLKATDYQALKFTEGQLTIDEFKPIKEQRQLWRDEINELQAQIGEK